MRLYLSADSKQNQGYTPDWIRIRFKENEQELELTMDITGETDYNPTTVDCRTKGQLQPWTIADGSQILDLDEIVETDEDFESYLNLFNQNIETAQEIVVGLYPTDDELYKDDILTNCQGEYEFVFDFNKGQSKIVNFTFETEINI